MTPIIRLCKTFHFEAAHALDGYHGKCKDIHGHSYELQIEIKGTPIDDPEHPECGMVMDFGTLKKIVKEKVIDQFDHHLILRHDSRFKGIEHQNERVRFVDYQPTCECMLMDIVTVLKGELADSVVLTRASLRETPTSIAEWWLEDNAPI